MPCNTTIVLCYFEKRKRKRILRLLLLVLKTFNRKVLYFPFSQSLAFLHPVSNDTSPHTYLLFTVYTVQCVTVIVIFSYCTRLYNNSCHMKLPFSCSCCYYCVAPVVASIIPFIWAGDPLPCFTLFANGFVMDLFSCFHVRFNIIFLIRFLFFFFYSYQKEGGRKR